MLFTHGNGNVRGQDRRVGPANRIEGAIYFLERMERQAGRRIPMQAGPTLTSYNIYSPVFIMKKKNLCFCHRFRFMANEHNRPNLPCDSVTLHIWMILPIRFISSHVIYSSQWKCQRSGYMRRKICSCDCNWVFCFQIVALSKN